MKRILNRHWSFLPTGPTLAVLLIVFWFFNQSYLAPSKSTVALFLENPIITFGLIIFGAHIGAFLSGEFSIKMPITFEPLVFALVGGLIAGVGAVVAEMSVHSTILFNLAGIFTLPAFMITKGWIYGIFMVLGGFTASKLLVLVIVKTVHKNREILVPEILKLRRKHRIVFIVLVSIFLTSVILVMMLPQLNYSERIGLVSAMLLLALFGFVTERGTICMSSMLKEWFISRSAYIWRSVLFTIMCLALFYQLGLRFSLYEPMALEDYVSNPVLLLIGSFILGFGFIFADGCFIGSLWKTGQGNVINAVGIIGLLIGIGITEFGKTILVQHTNPTASPIPNYISSAISPFIYLVVLWIAGISLLIVFKQKRYRY